MVRKSVQELNEKQGLSKGLLFKNPEGINK